jgi:hypothetical protein
MHDNGRALIAWKQGRRARATQLAALGSTTSGLRRPVRLSSGGRALGQASVAVESGGSGAVAFGVGPYKRRRVAVSVTRPDGRLGQARFLSEPVRIAQEFPLSLHMAEGGAAVLAWNAVARGEFGMRVSTRAPGGRFVRAAKLPGAEVPFYAGLRMDPMGLAFGVWQRGGRLESAAWRAGEPLPVPSILGWGDCLESVSIAQGSDGHALAAWTDGCGDGSPGVIRASRREPGAGFGAPEIVSDRREEIAAGEQLAVGLSRSGVAAVAWLPISERSGALVGADLRAR